MNSNLLDKLATVIEKKLTEDGQTKAEIILTLRNSWKSDLAKLENLYEKVLSEPDMDKPALDEMLSEIYTWQGDNNNSVLSRSRGLQLTQDFLSEAGNIAGTEFTDKFVKYLHANSHRYKVSKEEILHILSRNQLDLYEMFKLYTKNQNEVFLKTLIQERINLSGDLFSDLSLILNDFFHLQHYQGSTMTKKTSTLSTQPKFPHHTSKTKNNMILTDLKKIQDLINRKDMRKLNAAVADVKNKVNFLLKQVEDIQIETNVYKDESHSLADELAKAKEEARDRMKSAQQENKVLRSRNSGLNEETADIRSKYDEAQNKLNYVYKALDCLVSGDDLNVDLDDNNNVDEDVAKVVSAMKVLKSSVQSSKRRHQGQIKVNLITDAGKKLYIHTNKNNNIFIPDLEKLVGKNVSCLRVPLIVGAGYKEFHPVNGYIDCPALGWSDREYQVVTMDVSPHLGQGCTNTPGSGQRNVRRDGPMFPPHVVGPRICTE